MTNGAQVIVFSSQKGGSGKTTLSGHIAVQAENSGAGPVALIDTDPQGSLSKWWNARASDTPAFAQVSVRDLARDIEHLSQNGFKLIVIDTPPAITTAIAEVVAHADLVVIPTRPSPHDLRAVGPTVDIVEHARKPMIFVVNSATARARITSETAVVLSQHGTVAPVTIHHRVDFAASMIDGRTVGEVNRSCASAKEIEALWGYLDSRMLRLREDSTGLPQDRTHTFDADVLTPARRHTADETEENLDELDGADDLMEQPAPPPVPTYQKQQIETPSASAAMPEPNIEAHSEPRDAPNDSSWDGIDRRTAEAGPPSGLAERRSDRRAFGKRGAA